MVISWDTACVGTADADDIKFMTSSSMGLESNIDTAVEDKLFYYHRGIKGVEITKPILVMIHGYPQTSYMWRRIVRRLPPDAPLFIPDIPGYGRSSPLLISHSKKNTGDAILGHLKLLTERGATKQPIVLLGHDRGARICHRLALDEPLNGNSSFSVKGVIFLDIVPTLAQWESLGSANASVGSFHWPLLANVELATRMINAMGGDAFAAKCLDRWKGSNIYGVAEFEEDKARSVYLKSFKYESVIEASCDDYRAGAQEDILLQKDDQEKGKKLDVAVMVLYSADYLGKRHDVPGLWEKWMGKGHLECEGLGEGFGHFIAEEASDKTAAAIQRFYY